MVITRANSDRSQHLWGSIQARVGVVSDRGLRPRKPDDHDIAVPYGRS